MFYSCREEAKKPINGSQNQNIEDVLVDANKKLVKSEDDKIEAYIKRYKWEVTETGTGLRYLIYQHGSGPNVEKGKTAVIKYTVGLLNGDVCYSSENIGPKEFVVGGGGVESGIEEGILFLKKGDRAKFIIPSHLAFGLVGDLKEIPAKATLIYDIELVEVK